MTTIHTLLVLVATLAAQPRGEVLDFSATWCGPCQRMSPVVSRLEREGLPIRKVDVDEQRSLAQRFNVRNIPTFILVVDGEEVTRVVGPTTESELRRMIARIPQPAPEQPETVPLDHVTTVASQDNTPVPRQRAEPALVQVEPEPPSNDGGHGIFGFFSRRNDERETAPVVRGVEDEVPSQQAAGRTDGPMAGSARIRVTIDGRINLGSGTIIGSRPGMTLVMTCGHILRGLNDTTKIEVDVFDAGSQQTFVGSVVDFDLESDVGLISIPTDSAVPSVAICPPESVPVLGDRVACIGCSGGDRPSREQLSVTAINKYNGPDNIECTGVPVQGRSGGGLFNASGELIGICIAADPENQRGLYAHVNTVHDLLDRNQLTALYQPVDRERPPVSPERLAAVDAAAVPQPTVELANAVSPPSHSPAGPLAQEDVTNIPAGDAEVVVIIRPKGQTQAPSRVVIINQASPKFFAYLNGELEAPAATTTAERIMQTTQTVTAPQQQPEWYESRRIGIDSASQSPTADKDSLQPTSLTQPAGPRRYVRSAAIR